ncbi:MAG: hypothetical protein AVDCRST_MAG86-3494, partial [uncultured Truepera sp.]
CQSSGFLLPSGGEPKHLIGALGRCKEATPSVRYVPTTS